MSFRLTAPGNLLTHMLSAPEASVVSGDLTVLRWIRPDRSTLSTYLSGQKVCIAGSLGIHKESTVQGPCINFQGRWQRRTPSGWVRTGCWDTGYWDKGLAWSHEDLALSPSKWGEWTDSGVQSSIFRVITGSRWGWWSKAQSWDAAHGCLAQPGFNSSNYPKTGWWFH